MFCIYSTWIHKTPLRFSVPILHASQVGATPCSSSQTVYSFSTQLNFFPVSYYCEVVAFHNFFTQFSRLMIEIYLPHILPILLHLAIMYHLMTFSNNLPDFWPCSALGCWSSRNVKQVVTICTQSNFMFCVQQIEHNLDTLNSVQIGHQPTGRLASLGTYRQELICAHAV